MQSINNQTGKKTTSKATRGVSYSKQDIKQQVTDKIIAIIEAGAAKGEGNIWDKTRQLGMPYNYKTGKEYEGVNIPLLWIAAEERGYSTNAWLTFKQAAELGAYPRKGAKGVMCVFFKMVPIEPEENNDEENQEAGCFPMIKTFWLFNVADIEGLPELQKTTESEEFEPLDAAEKILMSSGAKITWQGIKAFYRPSTDEIYMPDRDRFPNPQNAYAVALHELTHWTGNASRLDRDFSGRFGSDSYAFEELVAELGSAFLLAHLGIEGFRMENHASYVQSWLRVLKNDKNAIFTASRKATDAYHFILEKAGRQTD